jgi:hypothetical protein
MQGRQADDSVADVPTKRAKTVTTPATISEAFFIVLVLKGSVQKVQDEMREYSPKAAQQSVRRCVKSESYDTNPAICWPKARYTRLNNCLRRLVSHGSFAGIPSPKTRVGLATPKDRMVGVSIVPTYGYGGNHESFLLMIVVAATSPVVFCSNLYCSTKRSAKYKK